MNKRNRLMNLLTAAALLTLGAVFTSAQAETLATLVQVSPGNEVPPVANLNATGGFVLTIEITRDADGSIANARLNFLGVLQFPGAVTITGVRIYEGELTANGQARFDSGISTGSPQVLPGGAGFVARDAVSVDPVVLARLLANPAGFYLNVHSTAHPNGALRAQLSQLRETLSNSFTMTAAQAAPRPAGLIASAATALTFSPTRNAQGQANGGNVLCTLVYDFPGAVTFTGLHIHEGASGANGPVRFNTGLNGTNTFVSANGRGVLNLAAPVNTADEIAALTRLLANPANFYLDLHSASFPDGALRAQLSAPLDIPPIITVADKYILPTSATGATLALLVTGADPASSVFINGQLAQALPDPNTGNLLVTVPAALTANPGTLLIQVRDSDGAVSRPLFIPVAAQASLNTQTVATIEAAGFSRNPVAPETIVAAFGARLAGQTVGNGQPILPTTLDGTTVYVNGVPAALFFVSANQINFLLPEGTTNTFTGAANLVVVARDGTVSQGQAPIATVAPGLFTRLANGAGAPAAVASTDGGVTFPIQMANADGTPVEIQAGNIVACFGTGLRFKSGAVTARAGGVTSTPLFVGAQGGFAGLDQINWIVPQELAGKGEMDLTFTLDGKTTNAVKIKVR